MKVYKTQGVLFMYELLVTKGYFKKEQVMSELEITSLTFLRYVQEIRAYLSNFDSPYELVYSNAKEKYVLVKI